MLTKGDYGMSTQNSKKTSSSQKMLTPREKAKRRRRNTILIIIEVIVLLAVLVACIYIYKMLDSGSDDDNGGIVTDKVHDSNGIPQGANDEVIDKMQNEEDNPMKDYTLIALFGVDSRAANLNKENSRSDTIMIAAIHKKTNEVKLVSVYRDTYLNTGDDYYAKCNTAYALGGYTQAVAMLNANLDLYIEDYITIGFAGLIETIDALGGIYVDVDSAEIKHLNNYQITMAEDLNKTYTEVTETGYQLLNGIQATAYCRIRYTKGDDYKRAERQREVVMAILEQAKKASLTELTEAVNGIIKQVSTSLTLDEILNVVASVKDYKIADQNGFPNSTMRTSGTITGKGDCVVPVSLAKNVKWLHEFLFNDTDYQVSITVQSYSDTIYSQVYPYLGELVNENK